MLRLAAGVRALALELLEAELVVFLHLPHLLLHLQDLEVELLDGAAELADLLLERGDARIARLRQPLPLGLLAAVAAAEQALGQRDGDARQRFDAVWLRIALGRGRACRQQRHRDDAAQ